jgi:hypothetical protein
LTLDRFKSGPDFLPNIDLNTVAVISGNDVIASFGSGGHDVSLAGTFCLPVAIVLTESNRVASTFFATGHRVSTKFDNLNKWLNLASFGLGLCKGGPVFNANHCGKILLTSVSGDTLTLALALWLFRVTRALFLFSIDIIQENASVYKGQMFYFTCEFLTSLVFTYNMGYSKSGYLKGVIKFEYS